MTPQEIQGIIEQVIKEFSWRDYSLGAVRPGTLYLADPSAPALESLGWAPALANCITRVLVHDLQPLSDGVQMGQDGLIGYVALQFTGENTQAVKDFLGDAYEGMRGGITEDDPVIIWFQTDPYSSVLAPLDLKPTDWAIKFTDPEGTTVLAVLDNESYQRLYGR